LGRAVDIGTLRISALADVLWWDAASNIRKIWQGGVAIG